LKEKINLLYIITKLELGGAQQQLLELIKRLDKEKFNPFLFTAKDGFLMERALSQEGLTVKRSAWLDRSINPLKDFLSFIEIYRFIRHNGIDFVHTHSSKAGIIGRWAAKLAGAKKIIHTVHGWSFNEHQSFFFRNFFLCLERITAAITDKLIVVCEYDLAKGLKYGIGRNSKYTIIRYGIRKEDFASRDTLSVRAELGIGGKDFVVGNISCFKPQKCVADFIRMAFLVDKAVPHVKFLLIGDGREREGIEKMVDRFSLRKKLILLGWRQDIPRLLAAMDVFVLTSLWEGLPISVLEAMASGRPVVATDTGGIAEAVREGSTGFLVPCRSIEGLSQKVVFLSKEKRLREEIGKNGPAYLTGRFGWDEAVEAHCRLYL